MQILRCRPALFATFAGARTPQALRLRWSSVRSGSGSGSGSGNNVGVGVGVSVDEEELQQARAWLAALHADAIPLKTIGELSFSRSSGPGGQNVNKVNSKATLRVPLGALLSHVPTALHHELRRSRYLGSKSNDIVVQADDSRKQNDNAHACYKRLYDAIREAGRIAVPSETSVEQMRHVKNLQKADNERRLRSKKQQSSKKGSRRARGDE